MSIAVLDDELGEYLSRRANPLLLANWISHRPSAIGTRIKFYRHSMLMAAAIARCALTPNGRLIIVTAPRHGKTEMASIWTPIWLLEMFPWLRIIVVSYVMKLARHNARQARNHIEANGDTLTVRLSQDSRAADQWNTPQGGGMLAAGVGGTVVGFGGDVILMDDLFKNWQEAHSPTIRQKVIDWYRGTLYHRLEPGGSIVHVTTRWHEEDLVGFLKAEAADGGEEWEILRLPALADDPDDAYWVEHPDEIVPDPLGRRPGEALCPERYDADDLARIMQVLGPYLAAGLYGQLPAPLEGDWFKRHRWVFGEAPGPADITGTLVRAWDQAASDDAPGEDPDWTVGVLMASWNGIACVLDVVRDRIGPDEVTDLIVNTAQLDGARWGAKRVLVRLEQEPGSAGKIVAAHQKKKLRGFRVKAETSTGSKTTRAVPWQAAQAKGEARLCRTAAGDAPDWSPDFVDEHALFPTAGAHDDQVDAAALAFSELDTVPGPATVTTVAGISVGQGGRAGRGRGQYPLPPRRR